MFHFQVLNFQIFLIMKPMNKSRTALIIPCLVAWFQSTVNLTLQLTRNLDTHRSQWENVSYEGIYCSISFNL